MIRLNISPLFIDHAEEVAEDLRDMYCRNIIDSTAFMCPMCPEGNPAIDKGSEFASRFAVFKALLKDSGLPTGILIQSSMGHGWVPNSESPFQKIVRLDGRTPYTMCPEDKEFRVYIHDAVAKCAAAEPDFFMLDDDTRFITGRNACFCPLHTARFNAEYGTSYTPDELRAAVGASREMAERFQEMLRHSMIDYAKVIRDAIDSVNPELFCSFCQCSLDMFATADMASVLAGQGRRPLVRLNDGFYKQDSARYFPAWLDLTAEQVLTLPKDITVISEPDTCPHNRYSTSAAIMRTHLTMSMMEGCKGGKLWITRLAKFEPASGKAYRKALADDAGLMEYACEANIDWKGPQIPVPKKPAFYFNNAREKNGWCDLFGRMGLPFAFSRGIKQGEVTLLTHREIERCSDDELREAFCGKVLLDGFGALALAKRGLAAYCGCDDVQDWRKAPVTCEQWAGGDISISIPTEMVELTPCKGAEVLSRLYAKSFAFDKRLQEMAPGAVLATNGLGGRVLTLALRSISWCGFSTAFSMLNESRKAQLVEFLNTLSSLALYFVGDNETLLKYGIDKEGRRVVELLNIGLDPIEEITLRGTWIQGAKPEILKGDGTWNNMQFERQGDMLVIRQIVLSARVVVFRI
ncbi:MAG: hypothetical protein IKP00_11320 [Victivallales bacterium]|nr:hypothetical protein [Victivallales bacterium]